MRDITTRHSRFFITTIAELCGFGVYNSENKMGITKASYTHNPQHFINSTYTIKLFTFLYPSFAQQFINKCVQTVSVNSGFYTVFTGPITTTTFNTYIRRFI